MIDYVVGLLFSDNRKRVTLIKKNRPKWQEGMLNGVGGKIEEGETSFGAMVRKFYEETGVKVNDWRRTALLEGSDFKVYFFHSFSTKAQDIIISMTDEQVSNYPISYVLPSRDIIQNLKVIIPLALDDTGILKPVYLSDSSSKENF